MSFLNLWILLLNSLLAQQDPVKFEIVRLLFPPLLWRFTVFMIPIATREKVMQKAAELQGCSVAGPWSLEGHHLHEQASLEHQ